MYNAGLGLEGCGLGEALGGDGKVGLRPGSLVHGSPKHHAQVAFVVLRRLVVADRPLRDRGKALAVDGDFLYVGSLILGVPGEGIERARSTPWWRR